MFNSEHPKLVHPSAMKGVLEYEKGLSHTSFNIDFFTVFVSAGNCEK